MAEGNVNAEIAEPPLEERKTPGRPTQYQGNAPVETAEPPPGIPEASGRLAQAKCNVPTEVAETPAGKPGKASEVAQETSNAAAVTAVENLEEADRPVRARRRGFLGTTDPSAT